MPWLPKIALGLGVLAVSAGCTRSRAENVADKQAARPVSVVPVKEEEVRRTIDIVGTLVAWDETTISAEAEGKVARIFADLGDRVTAAQPLVELDAEKARYRVEEQRAAVNRARAKYGVNRVDQPLPPIEVTPDVQKAAAALAQSEQTWKRADELFQRSLVPRQQLDDALAALNTAKAGYESALQLAKNLQADIDANEAALRLVERELRDVTIRAPFDGYVQKRLVAPGQFVKAQTAVMTVVKVDPLKVTGEVPERMAPWVKVGQPLRVRVDAYRDRPIEGTISRISPAVNQSTRAFPFEGSVPNTQGLLKPGTFARVQIASDRVDRLLTLPAATLQYRYGVNRVFVLQQGRLAAHEVTLGDRFGDRVEVVSGVAAGDSIAASDVEKLADGLRVTGTAGE
jgi:RND family efflux transporter MFP subunit